MVRAATLRAAVARAMMPSASRAVGSNKVRLREPRVGARLASPAAAARRRGLVRRRNRSPLDQVPPASSHGDGLRLYHQADRMMEAMSISRSDIAPATKGSEQGTGNDSRRRVWRIAIRRLRLVAVRISTGRGAQHRVCVRSRARLWWGHGGGSERAHRLGILLAVPALGDVHGTSHLPLLGRHHLRPRANSRGRDGARGRIEPGREGSYARWRECY